MNNTIEMKKIAYIYDNLPTGLILLLLLTAIVYFTLKEVSDELFLNVWVGVSVVTTVVRAFTYIYYKKSYINSQNVKKFYRYYAGLIFVSGLIWGFGILVIMPEDLKYQMFLVLLVTGLVMGAVVSNASKPECTYIFLFFALIPFLIYFLTIGDGVYHSIAGSIFIYIVFIISASGRISRSVIENFTFRIENENLIKNLEEEASKANRANEAKSHFLSVMSHEIRTPLNAIMGFIQVLVKMEKDSTKLRYLNTVNQSSSHLLSVINDILDVTKIESGKLELEFTNYNLQDEIELLYSLFLVKAKEKNIEFILNMPKMFPLSVASDKVRLKQIISNLLSNAMKFTPEGKKVVLDVDFRSETEELLVSVSDEGIGIAKENMEKVLKAFTQADASTTREYGGTGLGLSIVTKLLNIFNSKLVVKSELEKGSTFSFTMKVHVIDSTLTTRNEEETEKEISENDAVDFNMKKVLVAEDNATNQMLIKLLLEDFNLDVTLAEDGVIAENTYKDGYFDIVLMDINMPNKNGIEAMHAIKMYEAQRGSDITVVALTANSVSGDKEKFIQEGFDDYIAKPIDNDELIKVLKRYI